MACNIIWLSEPLFNQPSDDILTLKDDADPRLQTRHFTVSQISVPNTLPESERPLMLTLYPRETGKAELRDRHMTSFYAFSF